MRAGKGIDENSSDDLGEHARKIRSFSLRPLRRKRKRERFFDLEFFEKRFFNPRETAFIFYVFPRTLSLSEFSFGNSLSARIGKRRATPKLSSFRFDLTSIFSHRSFPFFLFISSSFLFLFRFVLPPPPPPLSSAVVSPFVQSNRK